MGSVLDAPVKKIKIYSHSRVIAYLNILFEFFLPLIKVTI